MLHFLAGLAPGQLVADLGMDAAYSGTQAGAQTSVTITVNPDGTWTVTFNAGDTPSGTPTSGFWATGAFPDFGLDYELQYAVSGEVGAPVVTNGASSFTAITAALTIQVAKNAANALADVTLNFRPRGSSSTALTEATQLQANGA